MLLRNVKLGLLNGIVALADGDPELADLHLCLLQLKLCLPYTVAEFIVLLGRTLNLFVESVFLRQSMLASQSDTIFQIGVQF